MSGPGVTLSLRQVESAFRRVDMPMWVVTGLIGLSPVVAPYTAHENLVINISIPVFFALLLVRLGISMLLSPGRRATIGALMVGAVLWAGGLAYNTGRGLSEVTFPSWAEALYPPAYLALAVHVLMDFRQTTTRRSVGALRAAALWIETAIMVGGVLCIAGLWLISPWRIDFSGVAALGFDPDVLFIVGTYNLVFDALLVALVLARVVLAARPLTWAGLAPAGGFVFMGVADVASMAALGQGGYDVPPAFGSFYAFGFLMMAAGACSARAVVGAPIDADRGTGAFQVVAAGLAVSLLVLQPAGAEQWFTTVPAVLTLVLSAARMVVALREASSAGEARRLALTDDLTGLPNRRAMIGEVDGAIRGATGAALLLLDIDAFKDVNDSLGHAAGDRVLRHVATTLTRVFGVDAPVARLGGDEFAILVRDDDQVSVLERAHEAREALAGTFRIEGLDLSLRSSIGVTVVAPGDAKASDVLRRADIALYEAKAARAGALLYDSARDEFTRDRLVVAEQLRTGIAEGQLQLWYQPQVEAATRRVAGVEALVRWDHPERGVLAPFHFLDIARRSGLMAALTERVMQQVVSDTRRWLDAGLDLRVSFNCAPPELLGTNLLPRLYEAIDLAHLPPDQILVEVTEESFVGDPELARETLEQMRSHHVQTAIDDYGTGFSSLAYLRDLPVQELKIDRSFVMTMGNDPRSRVIVDSTCRMAHAMGLRLVAEGVEDEQTADDLELLGVDLLQGYFVARPMPAAQVPDWVREWTASAGARDIPSPRSGLREVLAD